jgi:hypothetical protein
VTTAHVIRLHMTEAQYVASCSCGWRTVRYSRRTRAQDIAEHQHAVEPKCPPALS